jgi:RNA polymerase sigma factor (sigma-70 family)
VAGWAADSRFTDLVVRRRKDLVRLAVLLTGSKAEAEDAVQEAVLAVSRSWVRVLAQASEGVTYSYLRTAVLRKVVDSHRKRIPVADTVDVPVEDHGLLRFEQDRQFFALVAALPSQQRAVLVLRYYADFDDRRIAALLGSSRSTVRSNAMRGLDKLREQLKMKEKR